MTPEEINIVIAEWLGWKRFPAGKDSFGINCEPHATRGHEAMLQSNLPNWYGDLNAIAEAEDTLNINQLSVYADELDKICVPTHICPLTHWQAVVMAKAPQRSTAFVKAIGRWKDEPVKGEK